MERFLLRWGAVWGGFWRFGADYLCACGENMGGAHSSRRLLSVWVDQDGLTWRVDV